MTEYQMGFYDAMKELREKYKPHCTGHCWTHNEGFKWRGVQKEE